MSDKRSTPVLSNHVKKAWQFISKNKNRSYLAVNTLLKILRNQISYL